ncbi:MAG: hypothetical protein AMXMBFR56_57850 [Polyangiaceae bacterium]
MPGHLLPRRVAFRLTVLSFLGRSCSRGVMVALVALILVAQGAAMPHAVAAMFSDLCCDDCAEDGDCGESHERECDCPLGCKTCCAQASPIATLGSPPREAAPLSFIDRSLAFGPLRAAPRGVRADILHVPKATSPRFSPRS